MAAYSDRILTLTGIHSTNKSDNELTSLFYKILKAGIHGLCFTPYLDGQLPGSKLSEEQIIERIEIIKPYTKWIRTYSCSDGNEKIPEIARSYGLKTMVGAWLGSDEHENDKEISNLINIARDGAADMIVVGSEVMYREDMTEEELLVYIYQVKNRISNIPVGYVDAYNIFETHPKITKACDVILANCYPFWEGCNIEYSLLYLKDMYWRAVKAANGKKVIITSTGWPDKGEEFYDAVPTRHNAITYFLNAQLWSMADDIDIFYFTSFDESWKIDEEGEMGPNWGLWDKNGHLKF